MAIIEFVDRDIQAKKIDKKKKDISKDTPKETTKAEEKKQATS
jgi:large subunit ribosomal protein L17